MSLILNNSKMLKHGIVRVGLLCLMIVFHLKCYAYLSGWLYTCSHTFYLKLKNCGNARAAFYTTMFTEYTRNFSQRPLKTPDLWFGRTKSSIELQPVERKVGIKKVSNLKTVVTCLLQNLHSLASFFCGSCWIIGW